MRAQAEAEGSIDLCSVLNGARAISVTDTHYGHPSHLLFPDKGINMGDGWETARHSDRPPVLVVGEDGYLDYGTDANDNCVFQLACPGTLDSLNVLTTHFKGNFPESCKVESAMVPAGDDVEAAGTEWSTLLERRRLGPDAEHKFDSGADLRDVGAVSHLRVTIYPDGGIMRLRALGKPL